MFNFEGSVEIPRGGRVVKGVPYAAEEQKVEAKPIYHENREFIFMHNKKGWIYDESLKRVIPMFKPLIIKGGVNNATSRSKDGVDTSGAERMFEKRGFTIISNDPDKNGDYGKYIEKHEIAVQSETGALRNGLCYLPMWEKLVDYGDGLACSTRIDKQEFARFINCLLEAKVIRMPRIEILESLIAKYQGHLDRNASAASHNQAIKARCEKDLEIIENIRKQIDEMLQPKKEVKNARAA